MKRATRSFLALACAFPLGLALAEARDQLDEQILGAWQLEFTTPDGVERRPLMILGREYDRYVAWGVLDGQRQPFRSVEIRGDALVASIDPAAFPGVTVTLECGLAGNDRCAGMGRFRAADDGDAGEWTITGRRLGPADFDDHATWRLSFDVPGDRRHEPLVTVVSRDGSWYGWYQGHDHDLPVRSLEVSGDRVTMVVAGTMQDGGDVEATFTGTVSGDSVKGTVAIRAGGELGEVPFEGALAL